MEGDDSTLRYRSKLNVTPLAANKFVGAQFGDNTFRMTKAMQSHKIIVNIAQDQRQHQMEQTAVPDQQNVIIIFMFEGFDERHEAIPDFRKTFAAFGLAGVIVPERPIFVKPAM